MDCWHVGAKSPALLVVHTGKDGPITCKDRLGSYHYVRKEGGRCSEGSRCFGTGQVHKEAGESLNESHRTECALEATYNS